MADNKSIAFSTIKTDFYGKKISDFSDKLKKSGITIVDSNKNGIFDESDNVSYKVKKGDTLYKIARENGLSLKDILELNKGINPKKIKPNDSLWLQKGKPKKAEKQPVQPAKPAPAKPTKPAPAGPPLYYEPEDETAFELPTAIAKTSGANGKKKVVMIDIGHGGKDLGAVSPTDTSIHEADINERAAYIMKPQLEALGFEVKIAESRGLGVSGRNERVKQKKQTNPDYYLSIHTNAGSATANGEEVCYGEESSKGFASAIAASMMQDNTFASRKGDKPIQRKNLQVLKHDPKNTCSALVELGFITNPSDCAKLTDDETLKKQTMAIAMGIASYDAINSLPNGTMIAKK